MNDQQFKTYLESQALWRREEAQKKSEAEYLSDLVSNMVKADGGNLDEFRRWSTRVRSNAALLQCNTATIQLMLRTTLGPLKDEMDRYILEFVKLNPGKSRVEVPCMELLEYLKRSFLPRNDLEHVRESMEHLRQASGESLRVFNRKLNQVSTKDRYPLPQVSDVLDGMQGTAVFSTIDLKSGFHQILVDPADREKTAFICHRGLFEFVRMPFGLANGPSHFQRVMDWVFKDLLGVCVMVYIDDIVIYSKNMTDHISHLELVFKKLAQFGLQLKAEKCKFGLAEINLLGFVLNKEGIRANPEKTQAISSMPPLAT